MLVMLVLLALRWWWVARVVQVVLVLGAVEWLLTLFDLAGTRRGLGQPVARLVLILGGVTLVTALSAVVFQTRRLRRRYGLGGRGGTDP